MVKSSNFRNITFNYSSLNLKYKSNHPELINIDNDGKIKLIRPGKATISIYQQDNIITTVRFLAISNNGFISNFILGKYNASHYKKLMIVAHPDDEILWGGANLIRDRYFVVCLTNGDNLPRANNFREIMKFTNNSGIILNYPEIEDNVIDDWSIVKFGILKDLSRIIKYQN